MKLFKGEPEPPPVYVYQESQPSTSSSSSYLSTYNSPKSRAKYSKASPCELRHGSNVSVESGVTLMSSYVSEPPSLDIPTLDCSNSSYYSADKEFHSCTASSSSLRVTPGSYVDLSLFPPSSVERLSIDIPANYLDSCMMTPISPNTRRTVIQSCQQSSSTSYNPCYQSTPLNVGENVIVVDPDMSPLDEHLPDSPVNRRQQINFDHINSNSDTNCTDFGGNSLEVNLSFQPDPAISLGCIWIILPLFLNFDWCMYFSNFPM